MFRGETASCLHRRDCGLCSKKRLSPCYHPCLMLASKLHATLKVSCYSQSPMLLSKFHATLKVPCYYEQIFWSRLLGNLYSVGYPGICSLTYPGIYLTYPGILPGDIQSHLPGNIQSHLPGNTQSHLPGNILPVSILGSAEVPLYPQRGLEGDKQTCAVGMCARMS